MYIIYGVTAKNATRDANNTTYRQNDHQTAEELQALGKLKRQLDSTTQKLLVQRIEKSKKTVYGRKSTNQSIYKTNKASVIGKIKPS